MIFFVEMNKYIIQQILDNMKQPAALLVLPVL